MLALVACTSNQHVPVIGRDARDPTFDVTFLDQIDNAPAAHIAVGGRTRIKIPDGPATYTAVTGPFSIREATHDTFVIAALDRGTGYIEIETAAGFTRFKVTAAPIEKLDLVVDATRSRAAVALLDADGKRLVDVNLRLAGGGAPVSFTETWDQIEFAGLPVGVHDIVVQTDLLAPTKLRLEKPLSDLFKVRAARR